MKERPILFSGPMVKAILEGRKSQTRRIMKPFPDADFNPIVGGFHEVHTAKDGERIAGAWHYGAWHYGDRDERYPSPFGEPGDRLWVKETFAPMLGGGYVYAADYSPDRLKQKDGHGFWKPSIFCTRAASRITLEITGVRVERLRSISREDAIAEGIFLNENDYWTAGQMACGRTLAGLDTPELAYGRLWEHINGPGSWLKNPWVWVLSFKVVKTQ